MQKRYYPRITIKNITVKQSDKWKQPKTVSVFLQKMKKTFMWLQKLEIIFLSEICFIILTSFYDWKPALKKDS